MSWGRLVEARLLESHLADLRAEFKSIFIQEFIANPLLFNGYKFDIGVYVVITSVLPLRIYVHNGEPGKGIKWLLGILDAK